MPHNRSLPAVPRQRPCASNRHVYVRCVFGKKARKQQFERLWIGFTRLASGPELVDEVHSVAAAGLGKRAVRFLGAALEQLLLYPG